MKKKYLDLPRMLPRREFEQRSKQILLDIQKTLLPDQAKDIVAMNVETGEYVVGPTSHEALVAYRQRWREVLPYLVRVDGGPVYKFHGR